MHSLTALGMSVSGSQTPRRSDMQCKLKEHLHSVEQAHKADIQTYSSGHLGPNSLLHKPLKCRPRNLIWNKPKCKDMGPSYIQQRSKMEASVEKTIDALHSFTITNMLQEPKIMERPESPSKELLTGDLREAWMRKAKQERCSVSDMGQHDSCWFTHSQDAGLTWSDRLRWRQRFDTQVLRTKDLTTTKGLSGREATKRHERRLQQALRKLPASRSPRRERLTVFSDVFDDVCDGSPAFGSILREIKTEYDLYIMSLLSSQPLLQDKFACPPFGGSAKTTEIKGAARQVFLLEQETRTALEENNRVRTDYEDAQAKALEGQKQNESPRAALSVKECELSTVARSETKRRQVWKVWNEVRSLQKDIRETMVSPVTTSALENCIRDSEDEVINLAASNVLLRKSNKVTDGQHGHSKKLVGLVKIDLEQNISTVLSKAKVSGQTKAQVWEKIWTTLNGNN